MILRVIRQFSTLKPPLIDLKTLLKDPQALVQNIQERRVSVDLVGLRALEDERVSLTRKVNELNAERRQKQKQPLQECRAENRALREEIKSLEEYLRLIESQLIEEAVAIPNWSSEHSPIDENQIVHQHPSSPPPPQFNPRDHVDMVRQCGLVDFEGSAGACGAHFVALKGVLVGLELALMNWAINRATTRGFIPLAVPDIIRNDFIAASGFHPRSSSKSPVFRVSEAVPESLPLSDSPGAVLALSGTSEVFLAAQHYDQIVDSQRLPLKYVAWSHCFRSEVGHHSAQSRGLYRLHQFTKVELFALTEPDSAAATFDEITALQRDLLHELQLPYRVLEMARWELGAAAHRKWDHEVWMPGRGIWGEVMSTSNCTDFQSRRLRIRAKSPSKGLFFPHTLNGTACAIPRMLMALIENGWKDEDRKLFIPKALKQFYHLPEQAASEPQIVFI